MICSAACADESDLGRPDERLRDWTDRATGFYRDGLRALARPICFEPASTEPPLMIWRVRSTTLETRCDSIGPIPTCRRRRTTLDWLTRAIAPVWISIASTTDWVGWGHGEWPLVQTHTSGRGAISTPPRGVTSKPAATNERANSPAPPKR